MVTKKPKGLGRGLEALLGPKVEEKVEQAQAVQAGLPSALPLTELVPGVYQPRTRMDEGALYELAESIKAQGIMQPILVRRLVDGENAGKYEIIAGERRFRASHLAGLAEVPVLVREVPNEAAAAMALIENIQREDLNPLEEAQGLQRLVREFGLTHEQAAQAVGRSRSAASNLLRLLNLAEPVQTMLMAGDIDMGHARALLALDRAAQITAGNQIAAKKLSVREAESLVKKIGAEFNLVPQKPKKVKSRDMKRVEEELSDLLLAAAAMALIENIQREDLNPLEEAQGLQRLIREFGLTHEQAAQAVGRSRSAASKLLRLLNLAEPVQTMLMAGDIDMGHARALLALDRAAQITAGNQIAAKKLSVREAESLVKKIGAEFNLVPQKPKKEKSRDMKRVEEELSDLLMAAVEVRVKKRVKRAGRMEDMGELAIQFGSIEELNGLIERLRG